MATTLTIVNSCNDIIWPVVLPNPGSPPLSPSGFPLNPGDREILPVPSGWSGHVWARTHCATSVADAKFSCTTGDCGSSAVDCGSSGGGILSPPATVAEFTINTPPFPDTYSVSVVYGYNLPVTVVPHGPAGSCATVGCSVDFASENSAAELRVSYGGGNEIVGLKSACEAFGEAEYCCSNSNGSYSSSKITCEQNYYSELFKNWCPHARTFANDNSGTTFTCEAEDYVVNFCAPPTPTSGYPYNPTGGTG
ncbi:hypothetical protein TIFTF001_002242 [Ficus carica]|uniref:Thaumatin-like protein n=1 Tax=Ficus carica TaxID=3494 RepID=A0AA87ZLE3_FICCA|nr:hypothetical protein TIFTF001_002242 [Ficus carica]